MKKVLSIILTAVSVLSFCACGEKQGKPEPVNISLPISSLPQNLDPQLADGSDEEQLICTVLEGLYRIGSRGEPVKGAVDSYTVSDDGLTYTFTLKSGRKWSVYKDGEQTAVADVTAYDYEFGLKRIFFAETDSPFRTEFGKYFLGEQSFLAVDSKTLKITLKKKAYNLFSLLSSSAAMPCNKAFFESTKGRYGRGAEFFAVNGRYYITGWQVAQRMILVQNTLFPETDSSSPVTVTFKPYDTVADTISAFEKGYIDAVVISGADSEKLREKGYNYEKSETAVYSLVFNFTNKECASYDFRRALALAFSNEDFLAESGCITPATGFIPHAVTVGETVYREIAGDILQIPDGEKARNLLKSALASLGTSTPKLKKVLVQSESGLGTMLGYSLQDWQKYLSLFVTAETGTQQSVQARVESGDFSVALYRFESKDGTPSELLEMFYSKNSLGYFKNAEYDSLINKALVEADNEKRLAVYAQAEKFLVSNCVTIPAAFESTYFFTRSNIEGIKYYQFSGYNFDSVRLMKSGG